RWTVIAIFQRNCTTGLLQSVRWLQIFTMIASIIIVVYRTLRHLSRTIFDCVTIWFIKTLFFIACLYSSGLGFTQIAQVIVRSIASNPCDAQIPKGICLFRMAAASITPSFVFIHSCITIQQALATFRYSIRIQKDVARLAIFITICYAIIFGAISFGNENLTGKTQCCTSFNPNSEFFIIFNLNFLMAVDVINSIFALLLLRYNKITLMKKRMMFDIKRTFHRVQNLNAMEQFFPMICIHTILHFIDFCLYSYSYYFRPNFTQAQFTILYTSVNVMPYYCLFGPLVFLIMTKLDRFRRRDHVQHLIAPMQHDTAQD
ncbi:hypothetical protein PENTCL1PPCAC_1571, partial [Pristionchus entomophagus]